MLEDLGIDPERVALEWVSGAEAPRFVEKVTRFTDKIKALGPNLYGIKEVHAMPVTVASEWLNSCSGCEIAILNLGETLLELLPELDFVHIPVLMDHKHYGQMGDKSEIEIPEAVVGLVSGGIRNEEHLEVAREMRKKCKILIALGTCATHGGIPALINSFFQSGPDRPVLPYPKHRSRRENSLRRTLSPSGPVLCPGRACSGGYLSAGLPAPPRPYRGGHSVPAQ